MNRDSVNTCLLITCLGLIAYVAFTVSLKPSIQEIDDRVDTIVTVRQEATRALDADRIKRYIQNALADRDADARGDSFLEKEARTESNEREPRRSGLPKVAPGVATDQGVSDATGTSGQGLESPDTAQEWEKSGSRTSDADNDTGAKADATSAK